MHSVQQVRMNTPQEEQGETSRQKSWHETKVVNAIQKRYPNLVDEKAVHQDRKNAPERHAKACLPDRSERNLSELAPGSLGRTQQKCQQPSQQPGDRDREQPPEPLRG